MTNCNNIFSVIKISTGNLPNQLDSVIARGVLWQSTKNKLLLTVPGVAKYFVESGQSITVEAVPNASPLAVSFHMKMLPLAALVYQKGMLAFHAATVTDGKRAIILAGNSGSGKSTLLTELLRRGWRMQSDDISIVGLDDKKRPVVIPVSPDIALWPNSMKKLGIDAAMLNLCDENRCLYPVDEKYEPVSCPLHSIYILSIQGKTGIEMEEIEASSRFKAIGTILYNSHVADVLCDRTLYFLCAASIAQSVPVKTLKRPRGVWIVESLADQIYADNEAL